MKKNKNCQSCGMPLKRDPAGGGTDAGGVISTLYCSYCFHEGQFLYEGDDVNDFQEFCRQKMIETGTPPFVAWMFTRGMKRLRRWKS